jgi:hypothetical protein
MGAPEQRPKELRFVLSLAMLIAILLVPSTLAMTYSPDVREQIIPINRHVLVPQENLTVLIANGTQTSITSAGAFAMNFSISAPGLLLGSAWPNCYCGVWYVLNDTNFNQSGMVSGGYGWNFEINSPPDTQAVNASITFNLSLPAGSWHLLIVDPTNPPATGAGQRIPGPTLILVWNRPLVVSSTGAIHP